MSRRKKIIVLLLLFSVVGFSYWIYQAYKPPPERQRIQFVDSPRAVEDSMRALRKICEAVESHQFMNCYVRARDHMMGFRGQEIGRFDTLTTANPAFSSMEKRDVRRLLLLMAYLNRNFISGVFYEKTFDSWLYPYREDVRYADRWGVRNLYIWDNPKYPVNPSFVLDRKGKIVLLAYKDVE